MVPMSPEADKSLGELFASQPDVEVLAVFGSTAAGRLGPESDLDLYVRLRPGARWSLGHRLDVAAEATRLAGREVDLVVEDETTSVILRREVAAKGRLLFESAASGRT